MTEHELFKAAVTQNLVDDAQAMRASKQRKTRTRPFVRRILFAAACLIVAAGVTAFSIPSARAAVEDWLSGLFSPTGYFGQQEEERKKEPKIEAIITKAGEKKAVVMRVGAGFEAYADALDMTLDEIAYDGTSIFLSGTMSGATARPFVQVYTGGDTFRAEQYDGSLGGDDDWEYYYFACENFAKFVTADGRQFGGEIVPSFTEEMDAIAISLTNKEPEKLFENGELATSNKEADGLWDAYLADHDVRFSIELHDDRQDAQPLSGQVGGELSFRMRYDNVDSKDPVPLLEASFGTITIDASGYLTQTQTTQAKEGMRVDLGGVHPVTVTEWQLEEERTAEDCAVYYYTHKLDFTGASFSFKEITFTPTDTKVTLHVVLPASWTRQERREGEFGFRFLVDGKQMGERSPTLFNVHGPDGIDYETDDYLEFDYVFFESTLSPSQWAAAKTLTVIPFTVYWWEMKLSCDDRAFESYSLQDDAVVTTYANRTRIEYEELYDEMPQYALMIQLDDYR